jgi:hypothetical protein
MAAKRGSKFREQRQSCNAFIGDDERPAAILRLEIGGDFVPCPGAKMNAVGNANRWMVITADFVLVA